MFAFYFNITIFAVGLQSQNLIGESPVVDGIVDVEWSVVAEAVKRQYVLLYNNT